MGAPTLPIGTPGNVWVSNSGPPYRARTRFRDTDGVTRPVERSGRTKGAARAALAMAIRDRKARAAAGELTPESTVTELLAVWWPRKLANFPDLSVATKASYEDIMSRIVIKGVGALRLREATTGRFDTWLISERRQRATQADLARTILKQAFDLATQRDLVAGNPLSAVSKLKKRKPVPRAISVQELAALRDAVRGMRQNTWLADIFETQLALALRIGEALAITVDDLDLDNPAGPHVRIAATVITPHGQKFSRQSHTKDGPDGRRTLPAPTWVAEILRNRALLAGPSRLLFATRNDTLLDPHNVRESWRNIRDSVGLTWLTPHHLRKTSLTKIAEVFDAATAAKFADHKSVAVTQRHYLERGETMGPDVRRALDELAPPAPGEAAEPLSARRTG
jgi:integrase